MIFFNVLCMCLFMLIFVGGILKVFFVIIL